MPPRGKKRNVTETTATAPRPKKVAKKDGDKSSTVKRSTALVRAGVLTTLTCLNDLLDAHPLDSSQGQATTETSVSCGRSLSSIERLAVIVHGAFLITMAGKAQLRVTHSGQGIRTTVDNRWLEGLVRYCDFTVTADDIVECSAVFSDWLAVSRSHRAIPQDHIEGTNELVTTGGLQGKRMVRLKFLRESVPSVSEAKAYLQERWKHAKTSHDTQLPFSRVPDTTREALVKHSQYATEALAIDAPASGAEGDTCVDDVHASDAELLVQLSTDLRASLSETKLRAVIAQMRKDSLGIETKEQNRISKCQRRERLVSTYDLMRTLLGEKRSVCNLGLLVQQMVAQNRFGDNEESIFQQLVSLVRYRESGITVFTLDDEPQEQQEQGEEGRGGDIPLLRAREVDISRCSLMDLDAVLLRLDRQRASKKTLQAALEQE